MLLDINLYSKIDPMYEWKILLRGIQQISLHIQIEASIAKNPHPPMIKNCNKEEELTGI